MKKKASLQERKQRFSLTLLFTAVVFFVLIWGVLLAALTVYLLVRFDVIGNVEETGLGLVIFLMALASARALSAKTVPCTPFWYTTVYCESKTESFSSAATAL